MVEKIFIWIVAVGWLAVPAGICFFVVFRDWYRASSSKGWSMAKGEVIEQGTRVTSHTFEGNTSPYFHPLVLYKYVVKGQEYTGDRLTFDYLHSGYRKEAKAERIVARYSVGDKVDVFYRPGKPQFAVLERRTSVSHSVGILAVGTALGLPVLVFTLFITMGNDGTTAPTVAEDEGHTEVVVPKKAEQDVNSELIQAENNGQLDEVVEADAKDNALMLAASEGQTGPVLALLEAGANVNAKTDYGVTALMNAAGRGHTDIVRVLLEAGADVNAKTEVGVSVLNVATMARHTEVVELLKKAGAKE